MRRQGAVDGRLFQRLLIDLPFEREATHVGKGCGESFGTSFLRERGIKWIVENAKANGYNRQVTVLSTVSGFSFQKVVDGMSWLEVRRRVSKTRRTAGFVSSASVRAYACGAKVIERCC